MIASHSLLELNLAIVLYKLAGVDQRIGRVALGNPRGSQMLERMLELAEIAELDLAPFPWAAYKTTLDDLKKRRDLFAHSPWVYNSNIGAYMIFATSGKWPQGTTPPSRNRRIFPEGMMITAHHLRGLRGEIEKAIEEAERLDRFVQISLQVRASASP
jgi:hypothetical protein